MYRMVHIFIQFLFFCTIHLAFVYANDHECNVTAYSKCDFPAGFVFGAASAAYQIEGAISEGGRTPSIWDTFSHIKGRIFDGTNGDVAIDGYHRYKEIPGLLQNLGMDAYRFSISWSRIFPNGGSQVNPEGINYYNALIDELVAKGIKPYVTIYHWDHAQELEDSIGGWLSRDMISIYARFAETCFSAFGDRVKHWITLNEPNIMGMFGYGIGLLAPGRCSRRSTEPDPSSLFSPVCSQGNSSTEPYIAVHNMLLAHAAAARLYRENFQATQGGVIGMAILSQWYEPYSEGTTDIQAASKAHDFHLGWILNPTMYGDYPRIMRDIVKERLPKFTKEESLMLINSTDFVGINHYSSSYVAASLPANGPDHSIQTWCILPDAGVVTSNTKKGVRIGQSEGTALAFNNVPWGLQSLMNYIKEQYNNPPIIILENGMTSNQEITINDTTRSGFYQGYLSSLLAAMRDGANVQGYFVWSLYDGWEWMNGYTSNYGLYYVNKTDDFKREPKESAKWFARFLKRDCAHADM